ncbi:hypothetical protein PTTG_12508 [Puccinia triticina 1-1 BBBD Race 1]|uniref:Uncharacterized protein n=2 Tax=Puccinia triticina TaxID=208348 RepID=A0A180GKA9_PUCT1|nr:uncharacterized protein PtA15_11A64 [Puccinia triticina]OAV93226.1 hypothetical protein PTTG_12508 [Puccinia triticina 1-1 BBBD Race 1]WAQ89377.1 hypothetical protein PtA15_11A64 [Puccinia triticina]WAR59426.1 hypothetical protein PtB15_11B66 [Puccinia triticina]
MNFYLSIPALLLAAASVVIAADPTCPRGSGLYCFSAAQLKGASVIVNQASPKGSAFDCKAMVLKFLQLSDGIGRCCDAGKLPPQPSQAKWEAPISKFNDACPTK